ncbi:hypothetical protein D1007_47665 [Hordeum vulgare]|nr:hypothetical protein D1007_47665 [Hordeum vulgare]
MSQISKDSFDCHIVAFLWRGLKSCTDSHTQHDIGSRCTKVKQGSNHGAIYLLIHGFTIGITVELAFGWHGKFDWLEPLEHVLSVLGLFDECSFSSLFNFKPEKELQLSHHRHLKLLGH